VILIYILVKRRKQGWTNKQIIEHYKPEIISKQETKENIRKLKKQRKHIIKKIRQYENDSWTEDKEHGDFCIKKEDQKYCELGDNMRELNLDIYYYLKSISKDEKELKDNFDKYKKGKLIIR